MMEIKKNPEIQSESMADLDEGLNNDAIRSENMDKLAHRLNCSSEIELKAKLQVLDEEYKADAKRGYETKSRFWNNIWWLVMKICIFIAILSAAKLPPRTVIKATRRLFKAKRL